MLPLAGKEEAAPIKPKPPKLTYSKPWYGQSSWYGDHWKGRMTACGKPFDPDALTAAHPVLPCGTWLRVTNTRTGQSTFAKVTDRGPYEEGREIDVSERVAKRIGLQHYGAEKVKLEIVRDADGKSHPPMSAYTEGR
jgi:rare lipoprotein A